MEIRKQDIDSITAGDIKFMRRTAGHNKRDHKRNKDCIIQTKIKPVIYYIENYQRKWREYVNRMTVEESQNKFYIISQKDKDHSDVE
jgi:hypothetical protein